MAHLLLVKMGSRRGASSPSYAEPLPESYAGSYGAHRDPPPDKAAEYS